jgi:hypothetical protein
MPRGMPNQSTTGSLEGKNPPREANTLRAASQAVRRKSRNSCLSILNMLVTAQASQRHAWRGYSRPRPGCGNGGRHASRAVHALAVPSVRCRYWVLTFGTDIESNWFKPMYSTTLGSGEARRLEAKQRDRPFPGARERRARRGAAAGVRGTNCVPRLPAGRHAATGAPPRMERNSRAPVEPAGKHSAHVRSVTGQAATTADYADDPARSGGSNAQTASIEAGKSANDPVDGGCWTAKGRLWPRHVTGVNAYTSRRSE